MFSFSIVVKNKYSCLNEDFAPSMPFLITSGHFLHSLMLSFIGTEDHTEDYTDSSFLQGRTREISDF